MKHPYPIPFNILTRRLLLLGVLCNNLLPSGWAQTTPTVLALAPARNAIAVPRPQPVTVTFSQALDPTSTATATWTWSSPGAAHLRHPLL